MGERKVTRYFPSDMMLIEQKIAEQNAHPIQLGGESVSQQITRLLGTDDWAILHSGHQLVIDTDLDVMEAGQA